MNLAVTFASLALSAATGFFAVSLLWPPEDRMAFKMTKFFLSIGLGLGLSSLVYFLWIFFFSDHREKLLWMDIFLFVLLALSYVLFRHKKERATVYPQPPLEPTSKVLLCTYLLLLLLAIVAFLRKCSFEPEGGWDSWAIWKMHARFLYLGGENWHAAYANIPKWSHPDYPLLLPSLLARSWQYAGDISLDAGILTALVFILLVVGLLVSSTALIAGKNSALLAGIILLGTPFFISLGAWQISEIPLSFFLLASLALWNLAYRNPDSIGLKTFAGIALGLCAWTKNEGLLFCFVIVAAYFLAHALSKKALRARDVLFYAAGLLPVLAIVLLFKLTLGGRNTTFWFPQTGSLPMSSILDLPRHFLTLKKMGVELLFFGSWKVSVSLLLILYMFFNRMREMNQQEKLAMRFSWITLGLILFGFELVFVLAPFDLEWNLRNTLNKLLMQLWPSFLFCFSLMTRCPLDTENVTRERGGVSGAVPRG